MARDFTLDKYRQLIEAIISSNYSTSTVRDHILNPVEMCVILRHDVDRDLQRNLDMARLEHKKGIRSTYYFRHVEEVFKPEAIQEMADMGHEIGFHYEVMDKANGDVDKAIGIFGEELAELRKIADVDTVCMHGNPLAPWSNRDLWKKYDFHEFGIIGEPYYTLNYNKILYLTDTGRTWADRNIRVKDTIDISPEGITARYKGTVRTTDDVIALIRKKEVSRICLLVHPNRWCNSLTGWSKELVMQNVKNVGKAGIVWYRSKSKKSSKT